MENKGRRTVEEAKHFVPVLTEVDVCVIGGSTTGVFAAVRAARLGKSVAIVERLNCFGGNATAGMICAWHSLLDVNFKDQIIGGLTTEILDRLNKRNALYTREPSPDLPCRMDRISNYIFNVEELKGELDQLVLEHNIQPFLHTLYAAPYIEEGELKGVIVQRKSDRGVILAKAFVDATGDGDVCVSLEEECRSETPLQPASTGAIVSGYNDVKHANELLYRHHQEYEIKNIGWDTFVPNTTGISFWAKSCVYYDVSDADQLTLAEIEGRRLNRAMIDILNTYGEPTNHVVLLSQSSISAARETRQIKCRYTLSKSDVLNGNTFEDAIANGSYPSDIHHDTKMGATYQYLDGLEEYECYGNSLEKRRWFPEQQAYKAYWQIPFRSLIPGSGKYGNLVLCGRAIDADKQAFGAVRVMVILNQTGEAAGTAAAMCVDTGRSMDQLDVKELRHKLQTGGSIMI